MPNEYRQRLTRLRKRLTEFHAEALVVTHSPNIYYLCGFLGSAGILVVEPTRVTLITDSRYMVQAREQTRESGVSVLIPKEPILVAAADRLGSIRGRKPRIALDFSNITVSEKARLVKAARHPAKWISCAGWVEGLRTVKSGEELRRMRAAALLISGVFDEVFKVIRPGITELDLAAEIDYRMRKLGAEGPSFETIVASGPRAALPHARPTSRRLRRNELVVLDAGAILTGYCSDMTRTAFLGRAPGRIRQWYKAVREAQEAACEATAAGVQAGVPDAAARRVLESYKLGKYFIHSTGHGLGLEVHEDPRLAKGQKARIEPGMVVTIEPGVYVPGIGGIRIEDDLAVHANGTEILTTTSRELLEL
ncbi:MAG TPA: Xaa-Pro peptidase family protein [Candidatus Acidoferrales bacterium]|nr:Xaa-Pro peptidase family protein [Candidatus Acidoferrales bacterium]